MTRDKLLYSITLNQPAERDDSRIGRLVSGLEDIALASSAMREGNNHRAPWQVFWLFDFAPDPEDIACRLNKVSGFNLTQADLVAEPVPDIDWLAHSYTGFQPFAVGPFFIYGSHFDGDLPDDKTGLKIDAATAFGSGEHATTSGCLQAMAFLKERGFVPAHVLDMGTGSGILAVAACKLWSAAPVLAVDIEEEAVRVTNNHARLNNVAEKITARAGDGFAVAEIAAGAPFQLILANILAGPLKEMTEDLSAVLAPGGYAILSGMLDEQADEVIDVYIACGLEEVVRFAAKGWTSLLLQKPLPILCIS